MSANTFKDNLLLSKTPPLETLFTQIDNMRGLNKPITIRPSGLIEFNDHGLSWAVKQILGIKFGQSISTVIGTAVHKSAEFAYKSYIETKTIPSLNSCLIVVAKEIRRIYKYIPMEKRVEADNTITTKFTAYKRAKSLFTAYYDVVEDNTSIVLSVEEKIEYSNFQDNHGNPLNVVFAGSFDRIDNHDNELCVVDIKTSKKAVGGKAVEGFDTEREKIKQINERLKSFKPRKTVEDGVIDPSLKDRIKQIKSNISDMNKLKIDDSIYATEKYKQYLLDIKTLKKHQTAKRVPTTLKNDYTLEQFKEYQKTIPEILSEIEDLVQHVTFEFEIYVENEVEKLEKEIKSIENEIELITKNYHDDRAAMYDALSEEKSELENKIKIAQHQNDTLKMKEEHGLQIASYAILYELEYKRPVKYGKVERLVYSEKGSYLKTYVFDLSDLKEELFESLGLVLDTLIAWKCDNVPAKLLFRHNPYTFRGQEITETIKKVKLEKKKIGVN